MHEVHCIAIVHGINTCHFDTNYTLSGCSALLAEWFQVITLTVATEMAFTSIEFQQV